MKTLNLILIFANIFIYYSIFVYLNSENFLLAPDIGQGKSFILKEGKNVVMYDTGKNDFKILKALNNNLPFFKRNIDIIIISHPDVDHYLSLNSISEKYEIRLLLLNETSLNDYSFKELLKNLEKKKIKIFFIDKGDRIILNKTSLLVLHPDKYYKRDNDNSLVIYGKRKDFSFLLTGDIEKEGIEKNLMKYTGLLKNLSLLDFPHHGSKYSLVKEFFESINPKIIVIQSGFNRYGHPHKEVLNFFKNKNLWLTQKNGDLKIVFEKEWYNIIGKDR